MTWHAINTRIKKWLIPTMCMASSALCGLVPHVLAQAGNSKAIRVETQDVFVPVLVLDKSRILQLQKMRSVEFGEKLAAGSLDFGAIAVSGLQARDFQLLEDGHEQRIDRITPEFRLPQPVQDSVSLSQDFVGAGGGIWIAPGPSRDYHGNTEVNVPEWTGYLIAYIPPRVADGRCHQIAVKVDRPNSLVFGRTEYCNTADPLKGTDLGKKMESELTSEKKGAIGLSLAAIELFTNINSARVQIAVEFSPSRIERTGKDCYGLPEIRILGLIHTKTGKLAARFSDFMSRNFSPRGQALPLLLPNSREPITCTADGPSYETQIYLPPGEYNLEVALRDGKEFGRAQLPFKVESHDKNDLAASGIALVKRYRKVANGPHRMPTDLPVNYTPLLSQGLELTPTANTTFEGNQHLYYYFEVLEPPTTGPPELSFEAHLRILDAESGEVKIDSGSFSLAPYTTAGDPMIPIGGEIDINALPTGSYRLEMRTTDSVGRSTALRTANFRVD